MGQVQVTNLPGIKPSMPMTAFHAHCLLLYFSVSQHVARLGGTCIPLLFNVLPPSTKLITLSSFGWEKLKQLIVQVYFTHFKLLFC
jgi:hypothetical protein